MYDENRTPTQRSPAGYSPDRRGPLGLLIAALCLMLLTEWCIRSGERVDIQAVFIGPPLACIAIGGLIDPRIRLPTGRAGDIPTKFKVITALLAIVGFSISAFLLLQVFPSP